MQNPERRKITLISDVNADYRVRWNDKTGLVKKYNTVPVVADEEKYEETDEEEEEDDEEMSLLSDGVTDRVTCRVESKSNADTKPTPPWRMANPQEETDSNASESDNSWGPWEAEGRTDDRDAAVGLLTPGPVPQANRLLVPKAYSIPLVRKAYASAHRLPGTPSSAPAKTSNRSSAPIATSYTYNQQAKAAAPSNGDDAEDRRGDTDEREVTVPADRADYWQVRVDEGANHVATALDSVRRDFELAQASAIVVDEAAPMTVEELWAARTRWKAKRSTSASTS